MTIHKNDKTNKIRKKVYDRMYHNSISALNADKEKKKKRIIPTTKLNNLREQFKQTFLPLLIDVFELRQMIKLHKSPTLAQIEKPTQSPQEIIDRLSELQADMEESQRWMQGVISQISKGIEDAKEALQLIEGSPEINRPNAKTGKKSLWKRIFRKKTAHP